MKTNLKTLAKIAFSLSFIGAMNLISTSDVFAQNRFERKNAERKQQEVQEEQRKQNWMRDASRMEEDMMDGQEAMPLDNPSAPAVADSTRILQMRENDKTNPEVQVEKNRVPAPQNPNSSITATTPMKSSPRTQPAPKRTR